MHAEIVALLASYRADTNSGIVVVFGGSQTAEDTDSGTAGAPRMALDTDFGTAGAPRAAEDTDSGTAGVSENSRAAENAHSGSSLSHSLPRCISLK